MSYLRFLDIFLYFIIFMIRLCSYFRKLLFFAACLRSDPPREVCQICLIEGGELVSPCRSAAQPAARSGSIWPTPSRTCFAAWCG